MSDTELKIGKLCQNQCLQDGIAIAERKHILYYAIADVKAGKAIPISRYRDIVQDSRSHVLSFSREYDSSLAREYVSKITRLCDELQREIDKVSSNKRSSKSKRYS